MTTDNWLLIASTAAGIVAATLATLIALLLGRARMRAEASMQERKIDLELAHRRLEDRQGIAVRVNMPDGGDLQMTFPAGTDPASVEQIVKNLMEQYNVRKGERDDVDGR